MSKVSEAKAKQNYQDKPLQRRCRVCEHFRSKIEKDKCGYEKEVQLRCSIGRFAVKATAVCDLFVLSK